MKKFYEVVTKFYDNGMVCANSFIIYADKMPKSTFENLKHFDIYKDYFTDPVEAEQYRQNALNA